MLRPAVVEQSGDKVSDRSKMLMFLPDKKYSHKYNIKQSANINARRSLPEFQRSLAPENSLDNSAVGKYFIS